MMIDDSYDAQDLATLSHLKEHSPKTAGKELRPVRALLATSAVEPPPETLAVAREIAALIGAELHILRIERGRHDELALPRAEPDEDLAEDSPSKLGSNVQKIGGAHVEYANRRAQPDLVAYVADYARDLGAGLVIVPEREHSGHHIATLARAAMRPVLVARRRVTAGTVIAATELSHVRTPVVRQAAALGRLLHTTVAAIHNISPRWLELNRDRSRVIRLHPDYEATASKLEALVDATYTLKVPTAVLTSELDTVHAILRESRRRDAATIVVGASLAEGPLRRDSITAEIVNLADTSVLVIPVASLTDDATLQQENKAAEALQS